MYDHHYILINALNHMNKTKTLNTSLVLFNNISLIGMLTIAFYRDHTCRKLNKSIEEINQHIK